MTESWTDGRMDDLSAKVDRADADVRGLRIEMKTEFAALRGEMDKRFDKIDDRFEKVDARFEKVDACFEKIDDRFDKIDERMRKGLERVEERFQIMDRRLLDTYRMMMGFCGLMLAALIGLIATQI